MLFYAASLLSLILAAVHGLPAKGLRRLDDSATNGFNYTEYIADIGQSPTVLTLDTWSTFQFYLNYTVGFPTFRIINNDVADSVVMMTDLYCLGDEFLTLITSTLGETGLWSSSAILQDPTCEQLETDPDAAMAAGWSQSTLSLSGPATYDISIIPVKGPFGGGMGAIKWASAASRKVASYTGPAVPPRVVDPDGQGLMNKLRNQL